MIVALWLACAGSAPFGGRLPPEAQNVDEATTGKAPNTGYFVRAELPDAACRKLLMSVVADESLLPLAAHDEFDPEGDWGPKANPTWWHPDYGDSHFHRRDGHVNTCALCDDGAFYYWRGRH